MSVTIKHNKNARTTDAFAIIAEAWNELVQDGLTPDYVSVPPIFDESEVLYAISEDGDIVGVLVWHHEASAAAYVITLAYVEPSSRQQGVFTAMFAELKKRACAVGAKFIRSTVTAAQVSQFDVFARVGCRKAAITYEQRVS